MDNQTVHMKQRCYFIAAMCGMSLYSWYNYSLFEPINNSFMTPYYQNCLLMLFYLGWDTYHMTINRFLFYVLDCHCLFGSGYIIIQQLCIHI